MTRARDKANSTVTNFASTGIDDNASSTVLTANTTGIDVSGNATFGDNDKAIFGAGSDLQIYHTGSTSYIFEQGTGDLRIRGSEVRIEDGDGSTLALFKEDAGVELRYDGAVKLESTNTGVDVAGVITTDGMTTSADINFGDNDKAIFGAGSDLQIYHSGAASFISDQGVGRLKVLATDLSLNNAGDTASYIVCTDGGDVQLYHNGSPKLATTSTGVDVTGTLGANTVDLGNWTITESGGVLFFATSGTNKMKLDASGNLTVVGDVTAFGSV